MRIKKKETFVNTLDIINKFRFFNIFILIGFLSILLELVTYNFLNLFNFNRDLADFFALLVGIIFAFYFNFFYNFEIHRSKIIRAFIIFFIISFFSWFFQKVFGNYLFVKNFSYETTRLLTSGGFFVIGYFFHRQFSFSDFKKVGIAFYVNFFV